MTPGPDKTQRQEQEQDRYRNRDRKRWRADTVASAGRYLVPTAAIALGHGGTERDPELFHSTFGHCEPARWAPKLQWRPHRAMSGWCGDGHRSQSQLALLEGIFELSMIAAPQPQCLAKLPPRHLAAP